MIDFVLAALAVAALVPYFLGPIIIRFVWWD